MSEYKKCLREVKEGLPLWMIPASYYTADLCKAAFKINVGAIEKMPDEYKTKKMCLKAVKENGSYLRHVPVKYRTKKLIASITDAKHIALEHVPERLKTYEFCLDAVRYSGWWLKYVPEEHKDALMCSEAIKSNGEALEHVPLEQKSYQFCYEAIIRGGFLRDVPEHHKTLDLCYQAVNRSEPYVLHYAYPAKYHKIMSAYISDKAMVCRCNTADVLARTEEEKCILCKQNQRCVLFSPCEHKLICFSCSRNRDRCPDCNKDYQKKIVFLDDIFKYHMERSVEK